MKGALALLLVVLGTSGAQLCSELFLVEAKKTFKIHSFCLVSPPVWEARVFEYFQEGSSQEPSEVIRGQESYDALNLRRRFFEEADTYNERDYYDNIYLHEEVICFVIQAVPSAYDIACCASSCCKAGVWKLVLYR